MDKFGNILAVKLRAYYSAGSKRGPATTKDEIAEFNDDLWVYLPDFLANFRYNLFYLVKLPSITNSLSINQ